MKPRIVLISAICFIAVAATSALNYRRSARDSDFITQQIELEPATIHIPASTPPDSTTPGNIKLALILDTSNSMDGLIDQAKTQLWKFVNELSKASSNGIKPSLQIALYEYGNDRLSSRSGYVKMISPFTKDLDEISSKLFSLSTNGGSEFCGEVIHQSVSELNWDGSDNSLRLIFIAGNEPFNQGSYSYKEACTQAVSNGINVNTIYCGEYEEGISSFWQSGAVTGNGNYMSIEHDRKTVFYETPYDKLLDSLNTELNGTYLYYGSEAVFREQNQYEQDKNSEIFGSANKAERSVSKAGNFYQNSTWDLVDAYNDKSIDLYKIEEKQWPDHLRALPMQTRIQMIEANNARRIRIKNEILEINQQRLMYIDKLKVASGDTHSLDEAMLIAIREQATAKGFVFL